MFQPNRPKRRTRVHAIAAQKHPTRISCHLCRRRVGKTFLVRQVYAKEMIFQVTGIHGVGTKEQLTNFYSALVQAGAQIATDTPPNDWIQAFEMLKSLVTAKHHGTRVLFFDELPWMDMNRFRPAGAPSRRSIASALQKAGY